MKPEEKWRPPSPASCPTRLTTDVQTHLAGAACFLGMRSPANAGRGTGAGVCVWEGADSNVWGKKSSLGCSSNHASRLVFWRIDQFPSIVQLTQVPFMPYLTDFPRGCSQPQPTWVFSPALMSQSSSPRGFLVSGDIWPDTGPSRFHLTLRFWFKGRF